MEKTLLCKEEFQEEIKLLQMEKDIKIARLKKRN